MMGLHMLSAAMAAAMTIPASEVPVMPPLTNEGRAEDFHIIQLWSNDSDRFMKEWSQPTPPKLTTNYAAVRNQAITMFMIFDTCKSDEKGNCNLVGKVTITDPDGLPYGSPNEIKFWDNQPAPPAKLLILSPNGMGLVVEDGEKLGKYKVRMTVTDTNAGLTADTEQVITVTEASD